MELEPKKFKKIFPLPVTLITTCDSEGRINAAPYSCVMPVLRPLDLIAFASALPRDTLKNIHETGEFVVNVMGRPAFKQAINCAKDHPSHVDELKEVGLETAPSKKVRPPRVQKAVGWIEARLENELPGEKYAIIVGQVLCAEINEHYSRGDALKELPILLLFPHFRSLGEPLARRDEFEV
jgi:flavin reductase (DIM6/NTAB) family NADH-FMN oxidoreductase RutF